MTTIGNHLLGGEVPLVTRATGVGVVDLGGRVLDFARCGRWQPFDEIGP